MRMSDGVVTDLRAQAGIALVDLPEATASLHKSCFETARRAFGVLTNDENASSRKIQPDDDSVHVTGSHGASVTEGLSRYNANRRGFVFSDGGMLQVEGVTDFEEQMNALYDSMHSIADDVLTRMEQEWKLPPGWLQENLGPTKSHSQWHVKQYVPPEDDTDTDWLPMHTDPSFISIVIHDAPGKQEDAMGLEYQRPIVGGKGKEWVPVPHHGHAVAAVLVGSALSYMTGGLVNSCKHRVVTKTTDQPRIAATLFLRPRGTASMSVLPSPNFEPFGYIY